MQNAIFQAVSQEGKNLFTVGDVKQSIYRFRLADPTIFLDKYQPLSRPAKRPGRGSRGRSCCPRTSAPGRRCWTRPTSSSRNILSTADGGDGLRRGGGAALRRRLLSAPDGLRHGVPSAGRSAQEPGRRATGPPSSRRRPGLWPERIRQLLDEGYPVTEEDGTLRPCRPEDIVILHALSGQPERRHYAQALAERDIPCAFRGAAATSSPPWRSR